MGPDSTRTPCSLAAMLSLPLLAQAPIEPAGAEGIRFELDAEAFVGHAGTGKQGFNAVAADMDGDGDPDLLVNWHVFQPLELFENVEGRFRLANPTGADDSGLFENRGIPDIYVDEDEMLARIGASAVSGLFVWHDSNRNGFWHFVLAGREAPGLEIRANRRITDVVGLEQGAHAREGPYTVRVEPRPATDDPWHFRIRVRQVATQLVVAVASAGAPALPFYVGPGLTPVETERLELWKPDPHGIAWVDVIGTSAPDVFIARGGLAGALKPPHDPKTDRFYESGGDAGSAYRMVPTGTVPPSYGRGRQVEWVDVDADGRAELYIGNEETPNSLLVFDPESESYTDRAADLGLDFERGDVFTWIDLDDDGFDDLILSDAGQLVVGRNRDGKSFETVPGAELGLVLPALGEEADKLIDHLALRTVELDNDGRLDLLVGNYGPQGHTHLFLRKEGGFEGATSAELLAASARSKVVLTLDADNDGFEDVLCAGEEVVLLHNRLGVEFDPLRVGADWGMGEVLAGVPSDVDTDGREDVVLVTSGRALLRNRSRTRNEYLRVSLASAAGEPLGAVVRAAYRDGSVKAQRYGSAHNAGYCQSLRPLHFGIRAGGAIETIEVTWPGGEVRRYPVEAAEAGSTTLVIER